MGGRTLGILGALARSLLDVRLDFFPRIGKASDDSASAERIVPDLASAMQGWEGLKVERECGIDDAIDLAKASLAEVKAQTEYQDGKAARLLTVTSFVSALAGFLFTAFGAAYPLDSLQPVAQPGHLLPAAVYVAFLLFVLLALGGAITTFHATRTRFKYPVSPKPTQDGTALSHLFYGGIVGVTPSAWAGSFVDGDGGAVSFRDLKLAYLRNYVGEAYLVAAKTADKLRYLEPAQSMLSWALRFLLLFATLFALTVVAVPSTKPAPRPTAFLVDPGAGPLDVRIAPAAPPRGM